RALIGGGQVGDRLRAGNGIKIQSLEVDAPVIGKAVVRAARIGRDDRKSRMRDVHARAVGGVVGAVLPHRALGIGLGAIEALVVGAIAAPEVARVVGEVKRRAADRRNRTRSGAG